MAPEGSCETATTEQTPAVSQMSVPIVCEVLDPHTQKTIARSEHLSLTSDFCQSNRLVAQVMSMVAEERAVKSILDQLLSSGSCQIAVVPSEKYVRRGEPLSFWAVAKRAAKYGDVLIGFQTSFSSEKTVLNPPNKGEEMLWDNKDFAVIQGGSSTVNFSESMTTSTVYRGSGVDPDHYLRTPDAWRRDNVWTGDKEPGGTGKPGGVGGPQSTTAEFKQSVEAAVQTFLHFMPEATETSVQSMCLRLSCSELVSLSDALQVLRCAVSERPWVRPEARRRAPAAT